MPPLRIAACIAATCCFLAGPAAATIGKEAYKAHKERIEAEHDAQQVRCKPLKGNARDVCLEQVRGIREVAFAELEMQYKPTADNDEKLRMARADAALAVTLERCDAVESRHAREVCRKDAKAVHAAARVEAKLQREIVERQQKAGEGAGARAAAAQRQDDALFAAARERCDLLSGEAREPCLADVKRRFGRL